ncbi:MAG: hypothetical protein AAGC78_01175 [Cellvibrio sp.]|uniref:hypothetical protein n=1 Tax=Cellvibrio sp. TaxID=1965322 RepID=UPI0031AC71AB
MGVPIDISGLVDQLRAAASDVAKKDISVLKGFSERQIKAIAQQAQLVAMGIASGQITEETQEFFLDSLKTMAQSFANTLQGLAKVTIEKVWNAMVGVLWGAIGTATGIDIPALA